MAPKHQKGDAFRNTVERRYLQNTKFVKNAAADTERKKLEGVAEISRSTGRSRSWTTC